MKAKDLAKENGFSTSELSVYLKNNDNFATTSTTFGGVQLNDEDAPAIVAEFKRYQIEKQNAEEAAKQARIAAAAEKKRLEEEAAQAKLDAAAEKQRRELEAAERKRKALAEMLITSGFNFDGYTVVKYSGYISGDDAVQVPRGHEGIFASATNVGDALMNNLSVIRRNALAELKEQAYALGCNAIIGVDFDYLTLDPETVNAQGGTLYMPYVFGVTANGNAVIIQKN